MSKGYGPRVLLPTPEVHAKASPRARGYTKQYRENRAKLIAKLWVEQGGIDPLCGRPIDLKVRYPNKECATLDHISTVRTNPLFNDPSNLRVSHFGCNSRRGAKGR